MSIHRTTLYLFVNLLFTLLILESGDKSVSSRPSLDDKVLRCPSVYTPNSFAGRRNLIDFWNESPEILSVSIYNADNPRQVFRSFTVEPGRARASGLDNIVVGDNWGIQVNNSGICSIGELTKLKDSSGAFQVHSSQLGPPIVALDPKWLRDDVINLDSGFSLTGSSDRDLCLVREKKGVVLGCHNRNAFDALETVNTCVLCLTSPFQFSLSELTPTVIWYQNRTGGRDSNLQNLNSNPKANPRFDNALTGENVAKVYLGTTRMYRVLGEQQRRINLLSCSVAKSRSQIPDKYRNPNGTLNSNIISDLRTTLFSQKTYIAIGGYEQQIGGGKDASGAFTYSKPLHKLEDYQLFGLSLNTNDVQTSNASYIASTIFHEILHNFGFGHTSNDPESYKDRSVAILAMEDCMREESDKLKGNGNVAQINTAISMATEKKVSR